MSIKLLILFLFFFSFSLIQKLTWGSASSTVSVKVGAYYNVTGDGYIIPFPNSTGAQHFNSVNPIRLYNGTFWFSATTADRLYLKRFWNSTNTGNTGDLSLWGITFDKINLIERGPVRVLIEWQNTSWNGLAGTQPILFNATHRYYLYPKHWMDERIVVPIANITRMDSSTFSLRTGYSGPMADFLRFMSCLVSYPNGTRRFGSCNYNGTILSLPFNSSSHAYTFGVAFYNGSYPNTSITFSEAYVWSDTAVAGTDTFNYRDTTADRRTGYLISHALVNPVTLNKSYTWVLLHTYGRRGGKYGTFPTESEVLDATSDVIEFILDRANPASITTITGTYLGRYNISDTYNFTASSNRVNFNFTLGLYNRSLPVFHIRNLSNITAIKDRVWWKNYTAGNTWTQLTNYTDFVIQEGNSTHFGYDYILLMLNKTLHNSSQTYEIWISNDTDPSPPPTTTTTIPPTPGGAFSINLNATKVWWNDSVNASGIARYSNGTGISGTVSLTVDGSTYSCPSTNDGMWSCVFNAPIKIGTYLVKVNITNYTGFTFENSTLLTVSSYYGKKPIGTMTRVVYELPILIQDLNGEIRKVFARIIVWKG